MQPVHCPRLLRLLFVIAVMPASGRAQARRRALRASQLSEEISTDIPPTTVDSQDTFDKNLSMYLDGQSISADDDGERNLEESNVTASQKSTKKIKKEERAKRLAAETAVWVREQFQLDPSDQLVASFSAALVKSILLQGKLHVTTSALCFYSRIFGRTTKEVFPFSEMSMVKKRRGGFVANAIKIYFVDPNTQPVVIGSLNHRERAFKTIQQRLREVNPDAAANFADDASIVSAQENSEDRSYEDEEEAASTGGSRVSREEVVTVNTKEVVTKVSEKVEIEEKKEHSKPELVWRTEQDVFDSTAANAYHKKTERARTVIDLPVVEVFNVLFVSDWLKHYHETANNKDLTISEWYRASDGYMTRDLTFRRPLAYKIGPKETRVKEKQRYSFTKEGGVIVELEGQNLDAPYADYFVVESFFELKPHGDGTSTLFTASIAVHFLKSTILKGKIESGAMAETKTAYQNLMNLASKKLDEHKTTKSMTIGKIEPAVVEGEKRGVIETVKREEKVKIQTEKIVSTMDVEMGKQMGMRVADIGGGEIAEAKLEIRDTVAMGWLRMVGVGMLICVCMLLLCVVVLMNRLQHSVTALEKLIAERGMEKVGECVERASDMIASK